MPSSARFAVPGRCRARPSPWSKFTTPLPELAVWHFDLYRLEKPEDAYELGIEDAFADGISLIEWPERLGSLMPQEHLGVDPCPGPARPSVERNFTPHPRGRARIGGLQRG